MNNTNEKSQHEHTITIIINTRKKEVKKDKISFEELVRLADGLPSGPNVLYTVVYRNGHGNKPEGSLIEGESVNVKEGMIFVITATDKS